MIQELELTFKDKIAGSIIENPNIALKGTVEFTQEQYNQIYGSEFKGTSADTINFEFPIPEEIRNNYQYFIIYYKSKMDSSENWLRCNDKSIYNNDKTTYKQKMLQCYPVDVTGNIIKFRLRSSGNYGVYEVKVVIFYDDQGLNSYGGQYQYSESGVVTTVPIQGKKLEEITAELEGKPINSITNVTFAQIGTESVDS